MGDILDFPSIKRLDFQALATKEGETLRNYWQVELAESLTGFDGHIFLDIIKTFATSRYLDNMNVLYWAHNDFSFDFSNHRDLGNVLTIETVIRSNIAPEFSHQENTMFMIFLSRGKFPENDSKDIPSAWTKNDLLHRFVAYTIAFGDVRMSSKLQYGMAFLDRLSTHPYLNFVEQYITNSKFVATFVDTRAIDGQYEKFEFQFDFLPILLDSIALKYITQLDEET